MGCGAAKAAQNAEPAAPAEERGSPPERQPRAVAFDVPLGDTPTAAPPERFQKRAVECPTVTAEALRQKLAKAEQRRQEKSGIRNSKMFSEKAMPMVTSDES
ncbi:hypothetical protein MRX96_057999 [Rhipicephalus microplus]